MVKLTVNLDGVGEPREIIEPGRYKAKVIEIEPKDSQSGNPMLVWTWQLQDGSEAEIRSYTSLQEHALFGLKAHLTAFGLETEGELDFDTDKLVGKVAVLVVTKEQIKSRDSDDMIDVNRVKAVYKAEKTSSPVVGGAAKKPVVGGAKVKGKVPF